MTYDPLKEHADAVARTWSALRDRSLAASAATLGLSLLVLQITPPLVGVPWLLASWSCLLGSLAFGFVALVLDYHGARRSFPAHDRSRLSALVEPAFYASLSLTLSGVACLFVFAMRNLASRAL